MLIFIRAGLDSSFCLFRVLGGIYGVEDLELLRKYCIFVKYILMIMTLNSSQRIMNRVNDADT